MGIDWVRQIGTSGSEITWSVDLDHLGNSYIAGRTDGNLDGACAGNFDAFFCKYDGNGNQLWARQFGTAGWDEAWAVTVDASGNAYVAGTTGYVQGHTDSDAFLRKYDTNGNLLWSEQISSTAQDSGCALAIDGSGYVYVAGYTEGTLASANAGGFDVFLSKYDGSGNPQWTRQFGSGENDHGFALTVDAGNNALITGRTLGTLDGSNAGYADGFLTKFTDDGDQLWTTQFGTGANDWGLGVAANDTSIFVGGATGESLGGTSEGNWDAFLLCFDEGGNRQWGRQIGSDGSDWGEGLTIDAADNLYLAGHTEGVLGAASAGSNDAFVSRFDSLGNYLGTDQFGSSAGDYARAVAVSADGLAVYLTGNTRGDFGGPHAGGTFDAFLVRAGAQETPVPEPSSIALLLLATVTVVARGLRRRRRR